MAGHHTRWQMLRFLHKAGFHRIGIVQAMLALLLDVVAVFVIHADSALLLIVVAAFLYVAARAVGWILAGFIGT